MEENPSATLLDGEIIGIRFGLATRFEISTASISDCPISHASQLGNPFLGLPLEFGKCESCGTAEPGKCEGHFGYIELPIPIYHPCHISELKRLLSLLCLKCLKMRNSKAKNNGGVIERLISSCCEEASQVSIKEDKTTDGACYLELKLPSKSRVPNGSWNFLERYGYRYGDHSSRTLLPSEVMEILKRIPEETRRKLAGKGYCPQDGYILQYLPVPPNCLSVPEISDGVSVMSSDQSAALLKKVLRQVEIIKSSRSGAPNFESHKVEANDLQSAVEQYLEVRGTAKASRDVDKRFGVRKVANDSSTKAWLEKIRTLFIRKGSGFSSRSVITGDSYKGVNEIGLPFEIAQRITFEEKVNVHNMKYLQGLVDNKLCLTYKDGSSTYSLREGSMGHTFLRPGQVVHRRIMDGDTVFINRPPTTHKHSLQALSVYVHDDHTVKINPLICGPLSADFDGDCVHLFYPQSFAAKAEVLELFSVEKQLLSSHTGSLNLQLTSDSLLSLKVLLKMYFLDKAAVQQLAMFASSYLPQPVLLKSHSSGELWTALQILQTALPVLFDSSGERHRIVRSEIMEVDFNKELPSLVNEIVTSIFFEKGPEEVLKFFNSLQPLLMENLFAIGFSVGLEDFSLPTAVIQNIQEHIQDMSPLLYHLRSSYNELVELQLENRLRLEKVPVTNFILKLSTMGNLIDSKSDSAINKVVQQIAFLGLQLSDKGKFYSRTLVEDMAVLFQTKYPSGVDYPSGKYGLIKSCFFHGLDPYEEMVHSISSREVMVRSSRGLTEPGTLFKNLMAILRDVVICYDGTVRNVCSNSIIQFEYAQKSGIDSQSFFPAGEPVGVLAATAMSNPAYKAVLDSSPSSNNSWEMMKEILLCKVKFSNDPIDRRVILYLNDCACGRKYCQENAAYLVKNQLKKVSLKDAAVEFMIEYKSSENDAGLVGHIHLNKELLKKFNITVHEVLDKCQENIFSFKKKKNTAQYFKRLLLSSSECCSFQQSCESKWCDMPCLMFSWQETSDVQLEGVSHILAAKICPVLLETIIKGDPRICTVNIIWTSPDTTTWTRNPSKTHKGELAVDIVLEKVAVKQKGDAWRIVVDSCLPIIHLIDTKRSVPYAITQVQELLGISCAFDQAVQRLFTSVTMVTKGVLKEHLILLGNSMTCAGTLIGFTVGGYKELSRSLKVEVPFTEATLFTPRKCFEKAAEKRHIDSLSSIVASCSWGKHVSVGTGSRFEVLWDTNKIGSKKEAGIDIYTFLQMVSVPDKEVADTDCLGADIDYLALEDEIVGQFGMSPEHDSGFGKPVFEDSADFQQGFENQMVPGGDTNESPWDNRIASKNIESSSGGWDVAQNTTSTPKSNAWSGWGSDKGDTQDVDVSTEPSPAWGGKEQENQLPSSQGGWDSANNGGRNKSPIQSQWSSQRSSSVDNDQSQPETSNDWDSRKSGGLNKKAQWGPNNDSSQPASSNDWSTQKSEDWSKSVVDPQWAPPKASNQIEFTEPGTSQGWEAPKKSGGWISNKPETSQGWEAPKKSGGWISNKPETSHDWNSPKTDELNKSVVQSPKAGGWATPKTGGWNEPESSSKPESSQDWDSSQKAGGWATPKTGGWNEPESSSKPESSQDWDSSQKAGGWTENVSTESTQQEPSQGWNTPTTGAKSSQWSHQESGTSQPKASQGWDSPIDGGGGSESQWGPPRGGFRKNRRDGGEWKNKNFRPPNSPGTFGDVPAFFTATRQRIDMFTSDEQDVIKDVDPIVTPIKRIMRGYNDGVRLSAEDQAFIVDNVLNYHPDKASKSGTGIDYIMVNTHGFHKDSRCLYVVSSDGREEDFSYVKCIKNFVIEKYPELAESFNLKYFQKPEQRNRERSLSVAPETPRERSVAPETPRETSVAPEEQNGE